MSTTVKLLWICLARQSNVSKNVAFETELYNSCAVVKVNIAQQRVHSKSLLTKLLTKNFKYFFIVISRCKRTLWFEYLLSNAYSVVSHRTGLFISLEKQISQCIQTQRNLIVSFPQVTFQ